MAKKRKTLKEKRLANLRKEKELKIEKKQKKTGLKSDNISVVEEKYIKKDLLKTLITSIIFILIILGLKRYLN